jgi:hypothetical protein
MIYDSIKLGIETIVWLGGVIKEGITFYEENVAPVVQELSELKSKFDEFKEYKDMYIANKTVVLHLTEYIQTLKLDIKSLDTDIKKNKQNDNYSLSNHVKALNDSLKEAEKFIKKQIMPNNLGKLEKVWWIAQRIKQGKEIKQKFQTIEINLRNNLLALGASSSINNQEKLNNLTNTVNNSALEQTELKQLIVNMKVENDHNFQLLAELIRQPDSTILAMQSTINTLPNDSNEAKLIQQQLSAEESKQYEQQKNELNTLISSMEQQIKYQLKSNKQQLQEFNLLKNEMNEFESLLIQSTQMIRADLQRINSNIRIGNEMTSSQLAEFKELLINHINNNNNSNAITHNNANNNNNSNYSWKYKFPLLKRDEIEVNLSNESSILGAGVMGTVYHGKLKQLKLEIAFKYFKIPH